MKNLNLPLGTGTESTSKETLPAIPVKNKVIWINENFSEAPLKLEEGKPTNLGLFLTPKNPENNAFPLQVKFGHFRSGLIGQVTLKDNQEIFYRDIDIKGSGYVSNNQMPSLNVGRIAIMSEEEKTAFGIFDKTIAEESALNAEIFTNLGIRTERYIAITELEEIIDSDGNKISITDAIEKRLLNKNQRPVIGIRAFGTKSRVGDSDLESLKDAKNLVAKEQGKNPKEYSWKEYMEWFAKTAGENLGLMHKNKISHNYLTDHNITLDCRIMDLDSVDELTGQRMEDDFNDLKQIILPEIEKDDKKFAYSLFSHVKKISNEMDAPEKLEKIFIQSYTKKLGYIPRFLRNRATTLKIDNKKINS